MTRDDPAVAAVMAFYRAQQGAGHPPAFDAETIPGYLLVAAVNPSQGHPYLAIYRHPEVVAWYDAARAYQRAHGGAACDLMTAMYEVTEPRTRR